MANNLYDFVTIEAQNHQEAVERKGFYTDDTPVGPLEDELKNINSPLALKYAGWLRTKMHGSDILESLARWGLLMSKQALDAIEQGGDAKEVAKELTNRFNQQIGALTEDSELIDARGGKVNLGARLDETDAQLANIARYYTPEMFGAVGDGVTDDTDAMQKAINAGNHVILDNKVYKITDKLVIDHGIKITGVNPQRMETNRPYLDFSSCASENAIDIQYNGVHFEGFNIKGNRSLTTGIYTNSHHHFNFTNMGIYYCKYGFNFNRAWNITLNNCIFEFNDTCINLDGVNTSYSMINTIFYSSKNGFVSNQELDYSSMTSCGFDHCDNGIILEDSHANSLTLINCGFEDYITACYVKGDSQLNIIGFTCVNTEKSVKTFTGLGKVTYIGGRSDFLLLPDKKDVVFISPVLPSNVTIRDIPVSLGRYTNNGASKYHLVDTINSVSIGAFVNINKTSDACYFNMEFNFISNDGVFSTEIGYYGGNLFVPSNNYCNVTTTATGFKITFSKACSFRVKGYLYNCKFN